MTASTQCCSSGAEIGLPTADIDPKKFDSIMSDSRLFEVRITTGAAGTILRAGSESGAAGKTEELIRRAHHRGSDIALTVSGSDVQAVRRIELHLANMIHEVERS